MSKEERIRRFASAAAHARAVDEWSRPVKKKTSAGKSRINDYIVGADGLGWSWLKGRYPDYSNFDGHFNWCGAFAAFCWHSLSRMIRKEELSSTTRVHEWARGTDRMVVPLSDAIPGDIFVVGPELGYFDPEEDRVYRHGRHIGIVDEILNDRIKTIEGNSFGTGVDGRYNGVIRDERIFPRAGMPDSEWRVNFIVRPLASDLDPAFLSSYEEEAGSVIATATRIVKKSPVLASLVGLVGLSGVAGVAYYLARPSRRGKSRARNLLTKISRSVGF